MKMTYFPKIDPGTYHGIFRGVTETSHDDFGPGARWEFELDQGGMVSRTTKDAASEQNSCGKFYEMVSGLPLKDAVEHDTDEWVGQPGIIVVEPSPNGEGVRVASFTRDEDAGNHCAGNTPF